MNDTGTRAAPPAAAPSPRLLGPALKREKLRALVDPRGLPVRVLLAWAASWIVGSLLLAGARDAHGVAQVVLVVATSLIPAAVAVLSLPLAAVRAGVAIPLLAALVPEALRQVAFAVGAVGVPGQVQGVGLALGFAAALVGLTGCLALRRGGERPGRSGGGEHA